MVIKTLLTLAVLVAYLSSGAAELTVAERGTAPRFSIVYSTSVQQQAGQVLQRSLKEASGVSLELVYVKRWKKTPAVIIERMPDQKYLWEYRIFARNGNIHIQSRDENKIVSGSLKGVTAFLEHTTGFTAFAPGEKGYRTPEQKKITFDDQTVLHARPRFLFNTTNHVRSAGPVYETANNMLPAPWFMDGGGHTHWIAFPKKLFQTKPEYFAMIRGKRLAPHSLNWHSQYCYSHPDVEERIFRETRQRLRKKGIRMVEVGQNDGFRPCECDKCKKVDKNEQLWAMNYRLAQRLYKLHPDKKINIIAYGPTLKAPAKIKEFPPNVMIKLAPCDEKTIADWSRIKVPGGFSAYLYNWGWYQYEGFMPKWSIKDLKAQVDLFRRNNIKGLYRCGFGDLFGLEGYAYYIWGKLLQTPEADVDALLKRYCLAAYGSQAAPFMEKFFKLLDKRLELNVPRQNNWYSYELLEGKTPALIETSRLHVMRYPPEVRRELEKLLTQAEKAAPGNEMLKLGRIEFDYLCMTVELSFIFDRMRKTLAPGDWEKFLTALERRRAFIDALPSVKVRGVLQAAKMGDLPLFGGAPISHLYIGGRLLGQLRAPLNWDPASWRKSGIMPFGRSIKTDGKSHKLVQRHFYSPDARADKFPVYVSAAARKKDITVTFHLPRHDDKMLAGTEFYIFFGKGEKRFRFAGKLWQKQLKLYRRTKTNKDNNGMGDVYTLVPDKHLPFRISGKKVSVTIDPEQLGLKGNKLDFNVSCFSPFGYTFEYNLDQKNNCNCNDNCGEIILK